MKKEKSPKEKSPIEVLFAIAGEGKSREILNLLEGNGEYNSVCLIGKGTGKSEVADLFGFGILPREIVISLVKSDHSLKLIEAIAKEMQYEDEQHEGIAFTVPLSAIEKGMLSYIKSSFGGIKNG